MRLAHVGLWKSSLNRRVPERIRLKEKDAAKLHELDCEAVDKLNASLPQ